MAETYRVNSSIIKVTDKKYGNGASKFIGFALQAYLNNRWKELYHPRKRMEPYMGSEIGHQVYPAPHIDSYGVLQLDDLKNGRQKRAAAMISAVLFPPQTIMAIIYSVGWLSFFIYFIKAFFHWHRSPKNKCEIFLIQDDFRPIEW